MYKSEVVESGAYAVGPRMSNRVTSYADCTLCLPSSVFHHFFPPVLINQRIFAQKWDSRWFVRADTAVGVYIIRRRVEVSVSVSRWLCKRFASVLCLTVIMEILNVERWDVLQEFLSDLHDEYYYSKVSEFCN